MFDREGKFFVKKFQQVAQTGGDVVFAQKMKPSTHFQHSNEHQRRATGAKCSNDGKQLKERLIILLIRETFEIAPIIINLRHF